jgi:hypothetical protein
MVMEAGLTVILPGTNDIQIDSSYHNLEFISKHTVTLASSGNSYATGTLSVRGYIPVVGIKPVPGQYAAVTGISVSGPSGNDFVFSFVSGIVGTISITVYLFDTPRTQGTSGLQTFNANTALTYDSSRKYMKIVMDLQFTNYNGYLNTPIALPAGKSCAILQNQWLGYAFGQFFTPGESGPTFFEVEVNSVLATISGDNMYLTEQLVFRGVSGAGLQQSWSRQRLGGQFQAVDVTGY